jgi:hypothetical protein
MRDIPSLRLASLAIIKVVAAAPFLNALKRKHRESDTEFSIFGRATLKGGSRAWRTPECDFRVCSETYPDTSGFKILPPSGLVSIRPRV